MKGRQAKKILYGVMFGDEGRFGHTEQPYSAEQVQKAWRRWVHQYPLGIQIKMTGEICSASSGDTLPFDSYEKFGWDPPMLPYRIAKKIGDIFFRNWR